MTMLTLFNQIGKSTTQFSPFGFFRGLSFLLFLCASHVYAQNQSPQIRDLQASYDVPNNQIFITYDLADVEEDSIEVLLQISDDFGRDFSISANDISGDIGYPISTGNSKQIIWRPSEIINFPFYRIRVIASDRKPVDIQTLVAQVDSNRLRNNLTFLEGVRHRNEGVKIESIKDSLESRFLQAGLQTRRQAFNFGNYEAHNIEGRLLGLTNQDTTYILDGHFDGVLGSPAADDNGSAIAALLEAASILGQYRFQRSLKFVGFDLEEEGLVGSQYYVENGGIEDFETIAGVINLEMIGYYDTTPNSQNVPAGFNLVFPAAYAEIQANSFRGDFINSVANARSSALMNAFESISAQYVPDLSVISLATPGNSELVPDLRRSDHAVFWDAGYSALMLTDGADFRNPNYHTPNDTLGSLNFTFMQQVTQAAVATLAVLAEPVNATDAFTEIELFTNISSPHQSCQYELLPQDRGHLLRLSEGTCWTSNIELRLMDIQGRVVWEHETIEKEVLIQNRSYGTGIYYLFLLGEKGQAVEKIRF